MQPLDRNFTLADIFEQDPQGQRALFESFLGDFRGPQRQGLSNLFEPTFNRFLGQIGQQIRQGEAPAQTFNNFLSTQFNPHQAFLRQGIQPTARPGRTIFNF